MDKIAIFWCSPEGAPHVSFLPESELLQTLDIIKQLKQDGMLHVTQSFEPSGMVGASTFGAVENGKLPNGDTYDWMKRRRA
jgi:hypothetical protein